MADGVVAGGRFDVVARVLHWGIAVLVVGTIPVGYAMARAIGDYQLLARVHETVGFGVLVLAVLRIVNRFVRHAPGPYAGLGAVERLGAAASELLMYALFSAQPIVGWLMVSASGLRPQLLGGIEVPTLISADPDLYSTLRTLHTYLGYGLLVVFSAHILAVAFHAVVLRDGLLDRMLFGRPRGTVTRQR
ncbi:cytochrome b [Nocardia sp. NPDC052566]|uniref:cytochrome b n=1 Tax=Nocardia sp. NPDC052566 TaxID=3364330 RepID=UPI0037C82B51